MIGVQDLRIGNFAYPFDDIELVSEKEIFRDYIEVNCNDLTRTVDLYPIPLTEEWLLRFGFNLLSLESESYVNSSYSQFIIDVLDTGNFGIKLRFPNGHLIDIELEFVHTFQNIFFALTGKEFLLNKTA
jgi:hypothetical protein